VYEILHFPPNDGKGLFQGYVAYNYRDEMETSGWKSMTDEEPRMSRRRRSVTACATRTDVCVVLAGITSRIIREGI
jgi:hypothetical protein